MPVEVGHQCGGKRGISSEPIVGNDIDLRGEKKRWLIDIEDGGVTHDEYSQNSE